MSDPRSEIPADQRGAGASGGDAEAVTEPMLAASDAMLVLGVRRRDEQALAELYDRYGGLVFTLALRMVGDRAQAEEVMQETFLRCWRGQEEYDATEATVVGWLCELARGHALELLRSGRLQRGRSEREPLTEPGAATLTPVSADERELRTMVARALARLPDHQREPIELAYFDGLTQSEIATRLGEPIGGIKTRIRDGMRGLHRTLAAVVDGPAPREGGAS